MGKIWIEVSILSARGLRRTSSFWKLQWYAVGWIDPKDKYCTKIDASGNANPVWKTKFAILVDDTNLQDMALNVEVYSREPIFLREKLLGTATVSLKEFLSKYNQSAKSSRPGNEEVGSYQLRRRNSGKPQGFVDVSIHISEEREESSSFSGPGNQGGFVLMDNRNNTTLSIEGRSGQAYKTEQVLSQSNYPYTHPMPYQSNYSKPPVTGPSYPSASGSSYQPRQAPPPPPGNSGYPYSHPMPYGPYPSNYSNPQVAGPSYPSVGGSSYQPPRTPPPPPPANIGYIPTFLPTTDHSGESYVNMPSSVAAPGRGGVRPGFAMGAAAGALAAGAVIFGDDLMSGFQVPAGFQDASLTITTDPPF